MADPILLCILAARPVRAAKKLIAAVGHYVLDGGEYPDEIRDIDLCERFGWTLEELDQQDMARLLPALSAQGTRNALRRLNTFLDSLGRIKPTQEDMATYSWVKGIMEQSPSLGGMDEDNG